MNKKVSDNTLHLYTLGSGAVGVKNVLFGSWLLVYFNQILGLEPLLASYALAIALVFDAISDPLVGAWSDRFKSKWGRRHPFVYLAIIPFGISMTLSKVAIQPPGRGPGNIPPIPKSIIVIWG